jgi:hypothetical protein
MAKHTGSNASVLTLSMFCLFCSRNSTLIRSCVKQIRRMLASKAKGRPFVAAPQVHSLFKQFAIRNKGVIE